MRACGAALAAESTAYCQVGGEAYAQAEGNATSVASATREAKAAFLRMTTGTLEVCGKRGHRQCRGRRWVCRKLKASALYGEFAMQERMPETHVDEGVEWG
jgi:hypothetical protein